MCEGELGLLENKEGTGIMSHPAPIAECWEGTGVVVCATPIVECWEGMCVMACAAPVAECVCFICIYIIVHTSVTTDGILNFENKNPLDYCIHKKTEYLAIKERSV